MLARAVKLCSKSRHRLYRHAALVLRGGSIVSFAVNHDHVHAEVQALNHLWPDQRAGTRVISVRIGRAGSLGLAKPCLKCESYLRSQGVKSVTYSTPQGWKVERY